MKRSKIAKKNRNSDTKAQNFERFDIECEAALANMAAQVSHDIRSPLAALQMLVGINERSLDEDRLMRNAISRIRDIANSLSERKKKLLAERSEPPKETRPVQILPLVDAIVSERRLEYMRQHGVEIELKFDASTYGIFTEVEPFELKRFLSDLINSSVETLENGRGKVIVYVSGEESEVWITLVDTGKGIPNEGRAFFQHFANASKTTGIALPMDFAIAGESGE